MIQRLKRKVLAITYSEVLVNTNVTAEPSKKMKNVHIQKRSSESRMLAFLQVVESIKENEKVKQTLPPVGLSQRLSSTV